MKIAVKTDKIKEKIAAKIGKIEKKIVKKKDKGVKTAEKIEEEINNIYL